MFFDTGQVIYNNASEATEDLKNSGIFPGLSRNRGFRGRHSHSETETTFLGDSWCKVPPGPRNTSETHPEQAKGISTQQRDCMRALKVMDFTSPMMTLSVCLFLSCLFCYWQNNKSEVLEKRKSTHEQRQKKHKCVKDKELCRYQKKNKIIITISGALWAEKYVRGVVGRAITIDCYYEATYRSHTKYWCHGWTRRCSVLVETNGQHGRSGRVSITDNPEQRIFTVTIEHLRSRDTGWYSCAITTAVADPRFNVHLQVSDEHVSVPVIQYQSPAYVSRLGGSVSVSCESFQGSLPIQYRWYEKSSHGDPKNSDTNELALHCQSFNQQHHQYYCRASNRLGARSSAIVKVTVFNNGEICSYVTEINGTISGALWAEDKVRGAVGRAITIDCHYAPMYRSHTKYSCRMWNRQCTSLVNTNGQSEQYGRTTIRDNTSQGIFTVTMENLVSRDTGHYRCGIATSGNHPAFDIYVEVSDEPVSVPVLQYLSPANVSRLGGSVSVSCESLQGSLPIQYTWYEQTSSGHPKISDTNKLALHRQSFKQLHHQYYCSASNWLGARSSAMVNVTVFDNGEICSYVTEINGTISGALWAEDKVRGVVGRVITIDCHYAPMYRSHTKYLCRMWDRQCTSLVNTSGQSEQYGRTTIRDNTSLGIFTVTMENLVSRDTGLYRCGITTSGNHPAFDIYVVVSDEPVSVPLLRFSPTNDSSCVDSVSVSCESVHGSLPIQYSWYEKIPSVVSKISDTNKLDLHCQSIKYKNHLYYCKASNTKGEKSSEGVNVSISNSVSTCRNVIEVNSMGPIHFCENTVTESTTTTQGDESTSEKIHTYTTVLSVIGILLILLVVCPLCYLKRKNRESKHNTSHREGNNETQEMATLEENVVYTDLHHVRNNEAAVQSAKNETGIVYVDVKFKKKSRAVYSVTDEDNVTYADIKFQTHCAKPKRKVFSPPTPQD
ncbi:polymeric immunoglobulin receptor-like [Mobula hypostoma]|uniref:polymeric immunoglobulin receptor-like n=1 Tax=Mobula hypostoma TaxID=723540 RepID=UPI002FC3707A